MSEEKETKQLGTRIDCGLYNELESAAGAAGATVSDFVRLAITEKVRRGLALPEEQLGAIVEAIGELTEANRERASELRESILRLGAQIKTEAAE